jgi:hypothetical protein
MRAYYERLCAAGKARKVAFSLHVQVTRDPQCHGSRSNSLKPDQYLTSKTVALLGTPESEIDRTIRMEHTRALTYRTRP